MYPFLDDARSAQRAGDFERAYGAATAVSKHAEALAMSSAAEREALAIAGETLRAAAESRLVAAHALPLTREGVSQRLAQLSPVIGEGALGAFHERARSEIADALLAIWRRGEAQIDRTNYASAFAAAQRHRALLPKDHELATRVEASRASMARAHDERAAAGAGLDDELGIAFRRYHLGRAADLGLDRTAELARLDGLLEKALGVAFVVELADVASGCEAHKDVVASSLRSVGSHPVMLKLRIDCGVSRRVVTNTATQTYRVPVVTKRLQEVLVQDGATYSEYQSTKSDYCWGSAKAGGRTCSQTTTTTRRYNPTFRTELQEVEDVRYETRSSNHPVRTKTKNARFKIAIEAALDGERKTFTAEGTDEFEDVEVTGNGQGNRAFGAERPDGTMLAKARSEALAKAVSFVRGLGPARLDRALDAYERSAGDDPLRQEAAHAAVVWALRSGPRHAKSLAWLGERWGGRAPSGELAASIDAMTARFTPVAIGNYAYDTPTPPSYLHVAQGAGYLVVGGLSFDASFRQSGLEQDRSQALAGATYALGDGTQAVRVSGHGASSSILGDAFGYALGATYARSLRGPADAKRKLEVVAHAGVQGGEMRLDGGPSGTSAKERFVRIPIGVTFGAPFYVTSVHATVSFEPNLLGLLDEPGWTTLHPLSSWFGLTPFPWLTVEGGMELPFGAREVGPRALARMGIRL